MPNFKATTRLTALSLAVSILFAVAAVARPTFDRTEASSRGDLSGPTTRLGTRGSFSPANVTQSSCRILAIDMGTASDTEALDAIGGLDYDLVSPAAFATTNLSQYDLLYVGSDFRDSSVTIPAQDSLDALNARSADIAVFASGGGGIAALSEPIGAGRFTWIPLSAAPSSVRHRDDVVVTNPSHPVNDGLTSALLSNWEVASHHYFETVDPRFSVISTNGDGASLSVAATYGQGRVFLTGQDPDFHSVEPSGNSPPDDGAKMLLRNAIRWACGSPPPSLRFPWQYGTEWNFNGGPHDWSGALPGACVPGSGGCSGTGSGLDFGPGADDRVYAMAGGTVYFAGPQNYHPLCNGQPSDPESANVVKIRHSGGWETWYVHLDSFAPGIDGATNLVVDQGRYLGRAGDTGTCSKHLHVELCSGLSDGPPVVHCPNTKDHHASWDGQVIDGWTVHADCLGWTILDPPAANCEASNYNGYMSSGLPPSAAQALPCGDGICTPQAVGPSHNPTYIPILWDMRPISQGDLIQLVCAINTGQQFMYVSWHWGGSTVNGWLSAPDGTIIDPSTIDPKVVHGKDATSEYYEIADPQPGQWTVHSFGADLPAGPESLLVAAGSAPQAVPVGGIAEQPDAAMLPSQTSTAAAGNGMAYALGGVAAAALAVVATGGWAMKRRRNR